MADAGQKMGAAATRPSDVADYKRTFAHPGRWRLVVAGVSLNLFGLALFFLASVAAVYRFLTHQLDERAAVVLLLISATSAMSCGTLLILLDLFVLLPLKRQRTMVAFDDLPNRQLTVVLTAWNDEPSIAEAVRDFKSHPAVRRVIVVDNNSSDATRSLAHAAGAHVVVESKVGYGHCVYRALTEGASQSDTDLTLLCEGDRTFRAFDIDKFLAYIPHGDIVNGTRIAEQLRDADTQLTTFMFYGNLIVGKLLEAKYLGQATFTDVGTTYKLCRNAKLRQLLPQLKPQVDLAFNAHFLDRALASRLSIVECPITFHKRMGLSKGGNANNRRALAVGLRMIKGILLAW